MNIPAATQRPLLLVIYTSEMLRSEPPGRKEFGPHCQSLVAPPQNYCELDGYVGMLIKRASIPLQCSDPLVRFDIDSVRHANIPIQRSDPLVLHSDRLAQFDINFVKRV